MPRIFDVIEAPDQRERDIVVRVPEVGAGDFRIGSQVIVRENQTAVFYRDGKALDVFGPGRHTITTANIPLLINLLGQAFDGRSPFTAEVYFVNMREFLDMKWGTPAPIALRDPDLGLVRLRAFGTYSMQVSDPQLFVTKIVGTQGIYQTSQIEDFLRSVIVSNLTDLLGETGKGLFDLPAYFDEMGAAVKAKIQDAFEQLGLTLKQFYVSSISPTEETARAIDERASMGAIGNMQTYLQFQAARAMRDAAAGEGGGGMAGAGMGLGAGVGLGAAMAQAITQALSQPTRQQLEQQAQQGAPSSVPEVMTPAEAAAYLRVSEEDVIALIESGELKARRIGNQIRISKAVIDEFLKG
ncbi:MAG TPA: helix-turn-helix domain-containing protein [Caldilineae bacterium]|jgi:excisionase family DNA binding protein|nr:helix-turn-helix domain-containing protein [Caldilineae bacterium]